MPAESDLQQSRAELSPANTDGHLLVHRFEAYARTSPDAIAVSCGSDELSYAELNAQANSIALRLIEAGVSTDDFVALLLEPSVSMLAAIIGVMKSGAAYVPLDPTYPNDRLQAIVSQAKPRIMLAHTEQSGRLSADDMREWDVGTLVGNEGAENPAVDIAVDDLCYLMFTSGSTGVPNGVMVSHGNVAGLISGVSAKFACSETDHWSGMHSFAFGFSLWEIWGALSTGASLTLVEQPGRGDPNYWWPLLADKSISVLSITPSAFRQWLLSASFPASHELSQLRLIVFSGEAVRADDLRNWYERVGDDGPQLINTYALTETAGRITSRLYSAEQTDTEGNIGWPVSDVEVFVLDELTRAQVDLGETGEVYISGPMVARGYLGNTALTSERFISLDPGDGIVRRCYRSGDRASWNADGSLTFSGRADAQVKLRGYRIDLQDIEQTLRRHPAVADAAVVLRSDGPAPQLAAWVVPAAAGASDVEFWPSLGEYQIYDDLLYDFMSSDNVRVAAYQRAFERHVRDKVVLDIGTGKDAVLARLCAAAGARKVYAVEVLDEAFSGAHALVAELGQADVIEVMQGDMQSLTLPEPVDVCTQGIVGNIGSSDGIAAIWNDARQFFSESFTAIPSRCETLIAPAQLPLQASAAPTFGALASSYAERIFADAGKSFDVRLCVRNFPVENLIAQPAVFEDLDFNQTLSADYEGQATFVVDNAASFDGFLLWTRIQTDVSEKVDFLQHQQAWLPVWFPLVDESVAMESGDSVVAMWRCVTPVGQVFPDYHIDVAIHRSGQPVTTASYVSRHFETAYGQTELHRRLFTAMSDSEGTLADLNDWVAGQLPVQMRPTSWTSIDQLPLNANGKLDRQALLQLNVDASAEAAAVATVYANPLERDIAAIWTDVLGRDNLGLDDDFFAAGGDSILAVRLTTEVQRYLDDTVFLAALFEASTIATYSVWLAANHESAAAKCLGSDADRLTTEGAAAAVVEQVSGNGPVALSWPQQSLWFLQQLYPDNTGANEQFLIRVTGGADPQRLRAAWHSVLGNHDILRTCFSETAGEPEQIPQSLTNCIANDPTSREDLSALTAQQAEQQLAEMAARDISQSFDLAVAPLLRTRIICMPDDELVLLVTAHHIVADGMCVQLIRDALVDAYSGPAQPRPEFQYADFANSQRQLLTDAVVSDELSWWKQHLHGHNGQPVINVHAGAADSAREVRVAFELDAELANRLRSVASDAGATPFMVLLAAWRVWLQRCFADQDLLIGSPMTMRRDQHTADMLGCMVNNLVFRNPVADGASFIDILGAEKAAALSAFDHSSVPFERIVEELQPERLYGRHPLFQLMFMYEDRSARPAMVDGLEFSADVLPVDRASYWDLELSVTDCGAGNPMPAFLGFREAFFDVPVVSGWVDGFVAMLEGLAANPAAAVDDLPVLSVEQYRRTVSAQNKTSADYLSAGTLESLFEQQVAQTPAAIAINDAVEALTYAALNARAVQYAGALQAHGVAAGSRVGLNVARSADCVAVLLAVLKCGAAWLPLDPDYPLARLELMLAEAAPDLVVSDGQTALPKNTAFITVAELRSSVSQSAYTPVAGKPDDPAYILFTSGSTGRPKGSVSMHAGAVSRCRWMWQEFGFAAQDVFAQRTSLNFVDSVWEIFGPLLHGARIEVLPGELANNPVRILDWVGDQAITHLVAVPSLLAALLEAMQTRLAPAALRSVISSGEALSADLARQFFACLPGRRLLNTYGTSETWDASCYEVTTTDLEMADVIPVGKPVANASVYVLDQNRKPVPPGVVGELYIGGLALAAEYIGQPELTRERFLPNPFASGTAGARMYRSGDLGRLNVDGDVVLLGRIDRQIKLRGLRIDAREIESVAGAFSGVHRCALVLHDEAATAAWLALYVVSENTDDDFHVDALRDYLRSCLPRAMVPADIHLLDELPLTPSGKLDINALPASLPAAADTEFVAARNETEAAIAAIWAETLGLERVGVHDDFFALRGHSLLAIKVIARTGESLGIELPLQSMFETPTVAGIAQAIDALRWTLSSDKAQPVAGEDREVLRL